MCRPVTCKKCGKTTWAGCGQHVDQVFKNVPVSQRCTCDKDAKKNGESSQNGGLFSRLFGR
ncbi:hypothetical protein BK816_08065 [Boudabousia tangfeifanii]|uniref:Uncharacterized protein n=1 Tax=Boudabousia tangfeifanii TaxID=1912795 RepID=A0A1D9MM53_9ACTO|nr:hypothetical protein [Boudabousia tangfeifanii]AOZ73243.1 hypothetical protein BK816_08065 [Boudabousia tangfeifanii]